MSKLTFILVLLISLLLSCKSDPKSAPQLKATPAANAATKTPVATKPGYPKIPNELLLTMWNEGQMIDYIFHDLPFSMNQDEQASIRTNLTYIADKAVDQMPTSCKSIARQFYQSNGEIIFEAEVYFSDGCQMYVFWQDGKPKYSNYMSEAGVTFFKNMITQAMQTRQKIGQSRQQQGQQ